MQKKNQDMFFPVVLVIASLVILYFAAEWLVKGGASLAVRLNVSPIIVGLTVVSVGTSAPELVVSANAALAGQSALSIGNILGSNIFNICLILGISAIIFPLVVDKRLFKVDVPVMVGSIVLFFLFYLDGTISRIEAWILLAIFLFYISYLLYATSRSSSSQKEDDTIEVTKSWAMDIFLIVVGAFGLIFGSDLMVDNAVIIAKYIGISEAMIGLTIVAVGTSMPELATSVVAATKKQSGIALGNIIGSNNFNTLLIIGTSGAINPITATDIGLTDTLFVVGISVLVFVFMKLGGTKMSRVEGAIFVALYLIYFLYKVLTIGE